MARIRTIKPEFWQDEDLAEVSESANLLAIGLLNHADDEGYFRANPALIKSVVFPLREPSVTIHGMLTELSNIGYLELFEGSDSKKYGHIKGFVKHQVVNRPKPSKIKELLESVNNHGTVTDESLGKGKERKGKEGGLKPNDVSKKSIEYLNEKANKNFHLTESNLKFVRARIDEGYTFDDITWVVDAKVSEWTGTDSEKYLRPATLFNAEKFNQYIGEKGKQQSYGAGGI